MILDSFFLFSYYSSQGSKDGYFEMGLDDSVEDLVCTSSPLLAPPPAVELSLQEGELSEEEEEEEVKVSRVLWCYCLQVEEGVEQKQACLVLTDRLLGLLHLPDDFTWTNQDAGEKTGHRTYTMRDLSENKVIKRNIFLSLFHNVCIYLRGWNLCEF